MEVRERVLEPLLSAVAELFLHRPYLHFAKYRVENIGEEQNDYQFPKLPSWKSVVEKLKRIT